MNQTQLVFGQDANLQRVLSKTQRAILDFLRSLESSEFHSSQLFEYVSSRCQVSPSSVDRILRELRKRGYVQYEVVNRRQSLYRVDKVLGP